MTATIGVTFGAGSAAKRILLFAINVTVLLLGLTCSVLCLYQVKLMPETYEVIVAAIQESNLTNPTPEPVVTSLPSVTISKNNTTRTTKKGRPRVSRYVGPKNGTSLNPQTPLFPVTLVDNFGSSADKVPTLTISLGTLVVTKPVTLSQTTSTTIGSTVAKSTTPSSSLSTRVVTLTPIKNNSDEMVNFGQLLKDRIAELENELRIAQSFQKLPVAEFNFSNTQTPWTMAAITLTSSRSSESIPTTLSQQSTQQTTTTFTPTTAKSTVGLVSVLLSTFSTVNPSTFSTPTFDGLSSVSSQTSVGTSTTIPTTAPTEKSTGIVTTSTTEWPATFTPTAISTTTTTPVTKSTTTSTRLVTTPETSTTSSTTPTTSSTEVPVVIHSTSTPETSLATSSTTLLDPSTTPVFTPSTTPVIHQSVDATTTKPPTTMLKSSPSTEATTASTTTVMPTTPVHSASTSSSPSLSATTQKAATTLMTTTTTKNVATTKNVTTPRPVGGFIDLTDVNKLVGRRDLSARNRRASATTVAPVVSSSENTLSADHIPVYFEQVFFLVQTSLYVCTAAGLLIFFSSLVGICGGLFRIDGCLKFSVAALVLVIMAEMATTAFIFFAHDKASNRNKNKNFDRDLKLLCELANFCVQPMLLVITGSFLCVSVVLQIGSITLACNLMDNRTESDPDKKLRQMMRSGRSDFQFGSGHNMYNNPYTNPMPMPMPCCGGVGGYGGMGGHHLPYPPSMMMPMQNMYPPVFTGPGQRPIVNIIS